MGSQTDMHLFRQEQNDGMVDDIQFVRMKSTHSTGSLYFAILKIAHNNGSKWFLGVLMVLSHPLLSFCHCFEGQVILSSSQNAQKRIA